MVDETIATGLATSNAKHAGVYAIRNVVSGRVYVGSSHNIRARWNGHRHQLRRGTHHAVILQRSWDRHGEAAFVFEVLERVDDLDTLCSREQHWIDRLKAYGERSGFNGYPIAGSSRGYKWTEEQRRKHSISLTGRKMPPRTAEHSAAISVAKKAQGRKMTAEQLLAFSIMQTTRRRKPFSAAHRAALSASRMGSKASDKTKLLMSLAKRGKRLAPQHAANVIANLVQRNKTDAMRLLIAVRNKTPAMRLVTASRNKTLKMREVTSKRNKSDAMRAVSKRPKAPAHAANIKAMLTERNRTPAMRKAASDRMTKRHLMARKVTGQGEFDV